MNIHLRCTVPFILFGTLSPTSKGQDFGKWAQTLVDTIESSHYSPTPMGDTLSARIFEQVFQQADPTKLILTLEDIELLSKHEFTLDDQIETGRILFLEEFQERFNLRRKQMLERMTSFRDIEVAGNDQRNLVFLGREEPFRSERELEQTWNKYFSILVLEQALDLLSLDEADTLEAIGRSKEMVIQEMHCWFDSTRVEADLEKIGFLFLKAIAASYDPHTALLDPVQRREFEAGLATEVRSFGIEFEKEGISQWKVAALSPGGPAWQSGQLHVDDQLVSLKLDDEAVVLTCKDEDELYSELDFGDGQRLSITVKKQNGEIVTVQLLKAEVRSQVNQLEGRILKGDQRIGYISVPSFYGGVYEEKGLGHDLGREIMKLKREGIDGLILDLRDNGGGSIWEAMSVAGIFVDRGNLFYLRDNEDEKSYVKDMNRGRIYAGPLALMVNRYSASASEMLAGCLRAYNRAVLIGERTYGKGSTMSSKYLILPHEDDEITFTSCLVTDGMSYHVDGSSHHYKGLMPDILFHEQMPSSGLEGKRPYALSPSSGDSIRHETLPVLPVEWLNQTLPTAMDTILGWREAVEAYRSLDSLYHMNDTVSLDISKMAEQNERQDLFFDEFWETIEDMRTPFKALNTSDLGLTLQFDEVAKEINQDRLEDLESDPELVLSYMTLLLLNQINESNQQSNE